MGKRLPYDWEPDERSANLSERERHGVDGRELHGDRYGLRQEGRKYRGSCDTDGGIQIHHQFDIDDPIEQ